MPEIQGYLKQLHVWSQLEPAPSGWQSTAPSPLHPPTTPPLTGAAPACTGCKSSPRAAQRQSHSPACVKQWHINLGTECNIQQPREYTHLDANFILIPNQSCLGLTCSIFPSLLKTHSWYSLEGNLMLFVKCSCQYGGKTPRGKGRKSLLSLIFEFGCQAGNKDLGFGEPWQKRWACEHNT